MKRGFLVLMATCVLAGGAGAADVGFVADASPDAVKRQTIDGSAIVITRGLVGGRASHRVVTPARPDGAIFLRGGAAANHDDARAVCQALAPVGAWDLPDLGSAFMGMITIGAEFGPEHLSTPVVLDEAKPGLPHTLRRAYFVWARGSDERQDAALRGTDKLYVFTDGNGGADDDFISLRESGIQLRRALAEVAELPEDKREGAKRSLERMLAAVTSPAAVFCVSGLTN